MKVLVRDRLQDPEGEAVDWLELLEAMLRNRRRQWTTGPRRNSRARFMRQSPISRSGANSWDTLSQPALSLTRRYARSSEQGRYRAYDAKAPADGFHWRMIAMQPLAPMVRATPGRGA